MKGLELFLYNHLKLDFHLGIDPAKYLHNVDRLGVIRHPKRIFFVLNHPEQHIPTQPQSVLFPAQLQYAKASFHDT